MSTTAPHRRLLPARSVSADVQPTSAPELMHGESAFGAYGRGARPEKSGSATTLPAPAMASCDSVWSTESVPPSASSAPPQPQRIELRTVSVPPAWYVVYFYYLT